LTVKLPIFERLEVDGFNLFEGQAHDHHLAHDFSTGITLIVGTNGLGKTTLINIVLRCLIGPFNPPREGDLVVSARMVESAWRERRSYFPNRVGDKAQNAYARLVYRIGETQFDVTRHLANMALTKLVIGGSEIRVGAGKSLPDDEESEQTFRDAFAGAMGVSSYLAALQIIRHLVFVDETRRALLWDTQSQSAMLRDLLVGADAAGALRRAEGRFLSADSRERNYRWQVNSAQNELTRMRAQLSASPELSERLRLLADQIRADEARQEDLEQALSDTEQSLNLNRLELERTRLQRERSRAALEATRLRSALRLFPDLDATGQYILSRFYAHGRCRACGADVTDELHAKDEALARGVCLVCDSPPEKQRPTEGAATVAARTELVHADVGRQQKDLELADEQQSALELRETELQSELDSVVARVGQVVSGLAAARQEVLGLGARLPPSDEQVLARENEFKSLTQSLNALVRERIEASRDYKAQLVKVRDAASERESRIVSRFSEYAAAFLAEDAVLSYAPKQEKLGQTGERFELPRFKLDMTSAAYEGRTPRETSDDVSESQREFLDLAYRMSLIDACVDGPAAIVLETPEASLDGVFMVQAGAMLNKYGARPDRQMIVTSNLSNAGMIKALAEDSAQHRFDRSKHVVNLFDLATPTRAVEKFRDKYEEILTQCFGPPADAEPQGGVS
jgi:AAA domain